MDVLKPRTESKELLVWRNLHARSELTSDEKYYYRTLEKGYEGELMFDKLTKGLQCDVYILNGLLFEINNSYFQIDTLLIAPQKIYVYDVKNSEGDYLYEAEKFRRLQGGNDIKNPLHQLERCETLLRQFLKNSAISYLLIVTLSSLTLSSPYIKLPMTSPLYFQRS
ncbi:nuclease-related domain-containing protein [Neobacillus sp. PS2-9]|uniref:nuclease-related domain-containing protein n=1 Tax=Neobacillus sp. PS2-9 TaxID=3070676 RepID=UPI0027DF2E49|nr:nuclease-related domain-containing protein [Neobacillus sp. PS2-9]WML58086.1 nuclease-related domain-containing protein [Neobacillus sp. PS2-9]